MARGPMIPSLSDEAVAALQCGDIDALLKASHARWGGMVMMADDSDDDDDDDDQDDTGDDTGDDGDSGSADDKGEDKGDTVSRSELEKVLARMKAADKRADEAEAKIKRAEDAKKDELTKATERADELESKVKELTETVNSLRLNNAFLTANKHNWHNADAALRLAQSEGYLDDVVGDDGDVDKKALSKAMDRLASEQSYLVSDKEDKEDEPPPPPSGESAGKRSKNSKDANKEQEALKRRFPVLNR